MVNSTLAETQETAEYAIYIKALIHRQKGATPCVCLTVKVAHQHQTKHVHPTGQLSDSLRLFQQAVVLSPNNLTYQKQARPVQMQMHVAA